MGLSPTRCSGFHPSFRGVEQLVMEVPSRLLQVLRWECPFSGTGYLDILVCLNVPDTPS